MVAQIGSMWAGAGQQSTREIGNEDINNAAFSITGIEGESDGAALEFQTRGQRTEPLRVDRTTRTGVWEHQRLRRYSGRGRNRG